MEEAGESEDVKDASFLNQFWANIIIFRERALIGCYAWWSYTIAVRSDVELIPQLILLVHNEINY